MDNTEADTYANSKGNSYRMNPIKDPRMVIKAGIFAMLSGLMGCEPEVKVIYAERVGIFPDASGLVIKEIRSDEKGQGQLVLLEAVGKVNRDILAANLVGFDDVKFQSTVRGDTLILFHTQPRLDTGMFTIAKPSFPIRFERVSGAQSIGAGTDEGAAIFYTPDKWQAYLDMSRK